MSWTKADVDTLRRLREAGDSFGTIAKAMGRTRGAIASKWTKISVRGEQVQFWTPEKEQELRDLKSKGLANQAIAKQFGVSRSTVSSRCNRLGIRLSPEMFSAKMRRAPKAPAPRKPREPKPRKTFSFRAKPAVKATVRIDPDSPDARMVEALLESARRAERRCEVLRGGINAR